MPDYKLYIEALSAAKEEVLSIKAMTMTAKEFLSQVQTETEVEFPYTWEIDEISNAAGRFVQQIDVDIQAFEKKAAEGEGGADSTSTGSAPAKSLQDLVAKM